MPATQAEHGPLGQRSKLIRGAGGLRAARSSATENPMACGTQRSPRLGACAAPAGGRGLHGYAGSRPHGSVLGDITNVTAKAAAAEKVLKQKPQPSKPEPPTLLAIAISSSASDAPAVATTLPTPVTAQAVEAACPAEKKRLALFNYEQFYSLPAGSARLEQVQRSSAGIEGWLMGGSATVEQVERSSAGIEGWLMADEFAEIEKDQGEAINVQDVEEYQADLHSHLFQEEVAFRPAANYMDVQTDLTPKMRMILVDWLVEVHMKYHLRPETLHLTVNLIDRHLTRMPIMRKRLQLVGVVAIFIASKFEEINPPELHDWVYITDKAYTKEDVLAMECTMLTTLSFQIMVPTPAHFFPGFQKVNGSNAVHRRLSQYILELSLLDIRMLRFTASHVVAATLLFSNELMGRCTLWPPSMAQNCRHTEQALRGCVDLLRQLFEADRAGAGGQLQAVHKKFSAKEYLSVATMTL